tara:strand:- start:1271 stop:2170 length:900 start_codon:yes stop_codon:yes gene_type:complete
MDRVFDLLNGEEPSNLHVELIKAEKRRKKKVKTTKIAPVVKVKDDYSDPPHPALLRIPFSLLLIAPKGSGKTTLLHNILDWYYNYFDNVFIWSPTINIDTKWNLLIDRLEIPAENLFSDCKEADVTGLMRKIKDFNSGRENKEKIKCLFIFDDTVELIPKGKKVSWINRLAMNHRHYNISHIIVSQSFKKLDPVVRSNTTGMILFNTDNTAERVKIVEELAGNLGKMRFEEMWMNCVNIQYGFLYINYDTRVVYQNFDKVIGDLNCEPEYLFNKMERAGLKRGNKAIEGKKEKNEEKDK